MSIPFDLAPSFILSETDIERLQKIKNIGFKKILIIGRFYPRISGQAVYTANLAEGLSKLGSNVVVLTHKTERSIPMAFSKEDPQTVLKKLESEVKVVEFRSYLSSKIHENFESFSILEAFYEEDPDIVISTAGVPYGIFSEVFFGEKSMIVFQGSDFYRNCNPRIEEGRFGYLFYKNRRLKSKIFSVSEVIKEDIKKILGIDTRIAYPPVNMVNIRKKDAEEIIEFFEIEDRPILFVGRFSEEKGVKFLEKLSKEFFVVAVGGGRLVPNIRRGILFRNLWPGQQFYIIAAVSLLDGVFVYLGKKMEFFKETFCLSCAEAASIKVGKKKGLDIVAFENDALKISVPYSTFVKNFKSIINIIKSGEFYHPPEKNFEYVRERYGIEKTIEMILGDLE